MRIASLALVVLLVTPLGAQAQTSWGIGITVDTSVIFCDFARGRVWKVAPGGALTVELDNTYCHAVVVGLDGLVYGESITPLSATTTAHSIWRLGRGEAQTWLAPARVPDPTVWLVRDAEGRVYAWNGDEAARAMSQITRREPDGATTVLAGNVWGPPQDGVGPAATFGRIAGMAVAPDGTLVVADSGDIRRVDPLGRVTTEARGVVSNRAGDVPGQAGLWNRTSGVATDADGAAVVVDPAAGKITRIARDGRARVLWQSSGVMNLLTASHWGWRPVGVAMAGRSYYVLEEWPLPSILADLVGSPRLSHMADDGTVTRVASVADWTVRGAAILLLIILLSVWRSRRRAAPPRPA